MAVRIALVAAIALMLAVLADSYSIQKGRTFNRDITQARDCPRGFNILEQFDPMPSLDTCRGVINPFYIFKLTIFAPELETSVQLRATAAFSTAVWNAWAHYHPTAVDTLGKLSTSPSRRRPASEHTVQNRNIAIIYALAGVVEEVLPKASSETAKILESLQLDPSDTRRDLTSPIGVGNKVAAELVAWLRTDGWNSLGKRAPRTYPNTPFGDYTGYVPVNTAFELKDPLKWQPMLEHDGAGTISMQLHTTPQLGYNTKAFSMSRAEVAAKRVPAWPGYNLDSLKAAALESINISASLDDRMKMVTEFFDTKVLSVGGMEMYLAAKNDWCHDDWVFFNMLSTCVNDGMILAWKEKIRHQVGRPVNAIHNLMPDDVISAWGGPGMGTRSIYGNQFMSYMRTMPHAEFPSGSTCVCVILAEWTRLVTKPVDDKADVTLTFSKGCSSVEPKITPALDFQQYYSTWHELATECGESRRWAGVHFRESVAAAKALCTGLADKCYTRATQLRDGIYTSLN